jgi:hypothetical protein
MGDVSLMKPLQDHRHPSVTSLAMVQGALPVLTVISPILMGLKWTRLLMNLNKEWLWLQTCYIMSAMGEFAGSKPSVVSPRARQGVAVPLLGPDPALGIPGCSAREVIKYWIVNTALPGKIYQATDVARPPQIKQASTTMAVASLRGHAPVRKCLHIMGLFDRDPTCRFCRMETGTVHHIICYCEVLAHLCLNFFGKLFAEPKDIRTASLQACVYS